MVRTFKSLFGKTFKKKKKKKESNLRLKNVIQKARIKGIGNNEGTMYTYRHSVQQTQRAESKRSSFFQLSRKNCIPYYLLPELQTKYRNNRIDIIDRHKNSFSYEIHKYPLCNFYR